MPQRLILPIPDCKVNAGYKSPAYRKEWNYDHFGVDFGSRFNLRTLYGMGVGTVHSCGLDGANTKTRLGRCTVIVFKDVLLNDGKTVTDLACRMFHQERIDVKKGQTITAETVLGEYGTTGANSSGPHLHIEFDTDIKYPQYAVGIKESGNVIKKGKYDTTVDPAKVFWLGAEQSLQVPSNWIEQGWMTDDWLKLPDMPITPEPPVLEKFVTIDELKKMGYTAIKL